MSSRFKVGDLVVNLYAARKSSTVYVEPWRLLQPLRNYGPEIGETWIAEWKNFPEMGKHEISINSQWTLEETYNSPLYKALNES